MAQRAGRATDGSPQQPAAGPAGGLAPRLLVDSIGGAAFCLDADGRVVEWNAGMERISGHAREAALGQSYVEVFVPQAERVHARAMLMPATAGVTARGTASDPRWGIEIPVHTRWGTARQVLWSLSTLPPQGERAAVLLATGQDITGRLRGEALLEGQSHVLELVASGANLGVVLTELVHTIEAQAPGMLCSILRYDSGTRRLRAGAAPNLPAAYNAAIDGVAIGPAVGSCGTAAHRRERVIARNIDTDPLWADFRQLAREHDLHACWSQPILGAGQRLLGTFAMYYHQPRGPTETELELIETAAHLAGIALDRHLAEAERRRIEIQMQRAQKLESLGVLAGGIAHDFNNLLVGILGNADLLEGSARLEGDTMECVAEIRDSARRAAALCRQMLAYSGDVTLTTERIDLNHLVPDVARLLKGTLSTRARVEFQLDGSLAEIEGDPSQLQQVIMNLLTNASEALEGETGEIVITTSVLQGDRALLNEHGAPELPAGRYVALEVRDTGCGMEPTVLERVFDPFFTTKSHGHGLGLAAVLGILRTHRGTISVDSRPGQGTTFRALFPAADPSTGCAPDARGATPHAWRGSGTLLLVDDEESVRSTGKKMLERAGFSVLAAAGGAEATHLFQRRAHDIAGVVLDLRMPGMSGLECFHQLRRERADLPVLICTGHGEEAALREFAGEARIAFLRKPYELAELRQQLRSLLS